MGAAEELLTGFELKRKEDEEVAPAVNTGGAFKFDDDTGEITPLRAGEEKGIAKFTGGVKDLLSKGGNWINANPEKFSQIALGIGNAFAKPDVRYDFNGRPYESTSAGQRAMGAASDMVNRFQKGPKMAAALGTDKAGLDTTGMSPEEIASMMDTRSTILSREATARAQEKTAGAAETTAGARKTEAAEAARRTDIMAAGTWVEMQKVMANTKLGYAQLTSAEKRHADTLAMEKIFHKDKMDLAFAQEWRIMAMQEMDIESQEFMQKRFLDHQTQYGEKMANLDFVHSVNLAKVSAEHQNYDSYLDAVKNANKSQQELGTEYARIFAADPDNPALDVILSMMNQTVETYGGTRKKIREKGKWNPFDANWKLIEDEVDESGKPVTRQGVASTPPIPRSLADVEEDVDASIYGGAGRQVKVPSRDEYNLMQGFDFRGGTVPSISPKARPTFEGNPANVERVLDTLNNDDRLLDAPPGTFALGNRFVKGKDGLFRKALPAEIESGEVFEEGNR